MEGSRLSDKDSLFFVKVTELRSYEVTELQSYRVTEVAEARTK